MRRAFSLAALLVATSAVAVIVATTAGAGPGGKRGGSDVYIVVLEEPPAAAYEGGTSDLAATKPARGKKLDKRDANVQRYAAHLRSRHDDIANGVGASRLYDYEF